MCNYSDTHAHIHIHDIVSLTTTLVMMEPSVSLKDSNTVLNFRHYCKFEVNVQTMILIVTLHHNVKMCATIERGVFVGTNNGQNLLNLWVRHCHAHPLLEIANFFMQQVASMTNWTT